MSTKTYLIPIFSLRLGDKTEPAAFAGLSCAQRPTGLNDYRVLFIHRWKLTASIREILADVGKFVTDPAVDQESAVLVLDQTEIGVPAAADLVRGITLPVFRIATSTGAGFRHDEAGDVYNIGTALLVSCVRSLLGSNRLVIARGMSQTASLVDELQHFDEDGRKDRWGGLVLAVALACWAGENLCIGAWDATQNPAARSIVDRAPPGVFHSSGGYLDYDDDGEGADDGMYNVPNPFR